MRLLPALLVCAAAIAHGQELTQAQQYFQQGYAHHTGEGVEADVEVALRYYREALKLDPAMYEAHANAGRAYYALENWPRAQHHLSRAIAIARERDDLGAKDEATISNDLASAFYRDGSLVKAEKWFRYAIGRDPTLPEGHYNLINLLVGSDRIDEAKAALAVAARQAPSPRYGLFEGRMRSRESHAEWNPDWVIPAIVVFAVSLVLYSLYKRSRRT